MRAADPELPLYDVRTLEDRLTNTTQLTQARFRSVLISVFGLTALLLAICGLYGLVREAVAARAPEIGVRMMLGARPHDILAMILAEGLVVMAAGLGLGLAWSVALHRFLASSLYGVSPQEPRLLGLVAAVVALVSAFACALPASVAARVLPADALRRD